MHAIDLKTEVAKALETEWPAFAREHPNLAGVIDQVVLIEALEHSLLYDPEYQQAMEAASIAGTVTESLAEFVRKYVGPWLRKLL